jgi:CD2 antigen cytoplasmic tail-binding protein 2
MSRAGPSVRPKRGGDSYISAHEESSKKPRFDARNPSQLAAEGDDDGEDAILELDEIGKASGTKRSAVNLDGYDSDSDNDNFDARAAEKARAKKRADKMEKDDDDDDMFAELEDDVNGGEDEDDPSLQKKPKKSVNFIDTDDIAGQNFSSKVRSNVFNVKDASGKMQDDNSESEESDSGGEEGRAHIGSDVDEQELGAGSKKKHAPKLDAFNMRDEGEEGRFDESGNFVRQSDVNAIHDQWMDGVSKKDMKKARDAEEKREEERRTKAMERDAVLTTDLLGVLILHLQPAETVLEALARLNRSKPKQKAKWQKKKSGSMDVDLNSVEDPAETKRKAHVESITEAADELLSRGQEEIYDTERELLMRQYKRESGDEWKDPPGLRSDDEDDDDAEWQYRWADARDGGVEHGPYDVPTMKAWNEAGYFGEGVEFKRVGRNDWTQVVNFS